jgi:hypothetical protein
MMVYRNPYRRLTHEDNHILGFSLAGMLSWREQKIRDGKVSEEEIKSIEETNQRLANIVKQLEEAKMSELSRDKVTKSNFDVISIGIDSFNSSKVINPFPSRSNKLNVFCSVFSLNNLSFLKLAVMNS